MKTFKQFQHNIQEIDQNLLGPGLGLIQVAGNIIKGVGTAGAVLRNLSLRGDTPAPKAKKIPKVK
tara:strand:- start:455 stop:649 length:195 start_codon:yes stop_codon:yes gene_type:complete